MFYHQDIYHLLQVVDMAVFIQVIDMLDQKTLFSLLSFHRCVCLLDLDIYKKNNNQHYSLPRLDEDLQMNGYSSELQFHLILQRETNRRSVITDQLF